MNKLKQRIKDKLGEEKTASLKKALKVGRIAKNVICWTLVALLTLAIITFMITKFTGGTPKLFGYTINRIVSGSMSPELEIGDVIISKEVTDTDDVHIGDIITFQGGSNYKYQKVTHRVLVSPYNDGNGQIVLVTKGDANSADDGEINFNDVESKFVSKVDFLKHIYNFFFSKWGLIIFIFLLLLIFFDEITNIVKLIIPGREEEQPETLSQVIERIQKEQQENNSKNELPDGESAETVSEENPDPKDSGEQKEEKALEEKKESEKAASDKKATEKNNKAAKDTKKESNGNKKKAAKDTKNNSNADKKKASNNQLNHPKKKKKKSKKKRK